MKPCFILISIAFFIFSMNADLTAQHLSNRVRGNTVRYITSDGRILVWGGNEGGSLGNGTKANSFIPLDITNSGALDNKKIITLAAGDNHCVALDEDGEIYSWGHNYYGQLGDGSNVSHLYPKRIYREGILAGKVAISIAAGDHNTFVISSDHKIFGWGWNYFGMLGNGAGNKSDDHNTNVPVAIDSTGVLTGKGMIAVSSGLWFVAALDSAGQVYSWGINEHGALGANTEAELSNVPVMVDVSGVMKKKKIVQIATGEFFGIALDSAGHVYAWGDNRYGQLGNQTTEDSYAPVAVDTGGVLKGKRIVSIATGDHHCLALSADGSLFAWGLNDQGQLGNRSYISSNIPVAVNREGYLSGKKIIGISCGAKHSVVMDDEDVYTWGSNDHGQLGVEGISMSCEAIRVGETPPIGLEGFKESFNDFSTEGDSAFWTNIEGDYPGDNGIIATIEDQALKLICDPNMSFNYSVRWKFNAYPEQLRFFDLSRHPVLSFRVKVEPGAMLNGKAIDLVDIGLDVIGSNEYLSEQVPDDGIWHDVYYEFDKNNIVYAHATEFRLHPGLKEALLENEHGFSGTVWLDDLRIGDMVDFPADVEKATGFSEDFSEAVNTSFWIPNTKVHSDGTPIFFVLQQQGALKVRMKQEYDTDGQMYEFNKQHLVLDLSANPSVRFDLKIESDASLSGRYVDSLKFSLSPFTSGYSERNKLVLPYTQLHSPVSVMAPADDQWHTYTFDWSSADTEPASDAYVYPNVYDEVASIYLETVQAPGTLYEASFWLDNVRIGDEIGNTTSIGRHLDNMTGASLSQNFPNPFTRSTIIQFEIEKESWVRVRVYDSAGNLKCILLDQKRPGGIHSLQFAPKAMPAGLYYYVLSTNNYTAVKAMILLNP